MKNQLRVLLALVLINVFVPVTHAQAQQQNLADSTQMIAAESGTTRDAVNQMLRHIADQSAHVEFNARDYREKTAHFQARISGALAAFETYLNTSIFSRLNALATRYNSVYNSTSMSEEQRSQLLIQQLAIIERELPQIRDDYRRAIRNVYYAAGNVPIFLNRYIVSDPSNRDRRTHGCRRGEGYYVQSYSIPQSGSKSAHSVSVVNCIGSRRPGLRQSVSIDRRQVFQELIYPELRSGCRSQICLGLSASDIKTYIDLVRTRIDRPISIMLANNSAHLELQALALQPIIRKHPAVHNIDEDLNEDLDVIQEILSRVDYPAEALALPFDTE